MQKIWLEQYPPGVPAEINPDIYPSLIALIHDSCNKFADKPAFSNFSCQLTFSEFSTLSHAFAAYLQQKLHLKKGDRIAIMMPNTLQYPVVLFGALLAGVVIINVNPLYTAAELTHMMNDSGVETIVVLTSFAHVVQAALPDTRLKNIIVSELGDLFPWGKAQLINFVVKYIKRSVRVWSIMGHIPFKQLIKDGAALTFQPVELFGQDVAFLQYTGGTTGVVKGAMLTHRNLLANIEQVVAWMHSELCEGTEVIVTPLPLYHVFALLANLLVFIRYGAKNILITNPRDIPGLIAELKKVPFSGITGVNTLFNALLNHAEFAKLDFSHLKVALGGGASIQKSVAERWEAITGKALLEGYGLTEASPVVCIDPLNSATYNGSVGLPVPSTELSIRDDEGKEVAQGEHGEIWVRGPQIMQGYWHNPEETQRVLTADGWLLTGDIGYIDSKGYVYLADRKKELILVSGFNVYPNEVEAVIASHPGVLEAAVIGVTDAKTGEAVKAFVVRKDPTLTVEALQSYCRQYLTGYKLPKSFEFRESLPKSPIGKVLRRALRDISTD